MMKTVVIWVWLCLFCEHSCGHQVLEPIWIPFCRSCKYRILVAMKTLEDTHDPVGNYHNPHSSMVKFLNDHRSCSSTLCCLIFPYLSSSLLANWLDHKVQKLIKGVLAVICGTSVYKSKVFVRSEKMNSLFPLGKTEYLCMSDSWERSRQIEREGDKCVWW